VDDDSSISMCSGVDSHQGGGIDASSLSQGDSCRTSRADCPPRKRRKTIVDALNHIAITERAQQVPTEALVAEDGDSSLIAGGPGTGDENSLTSASDEEDEELLSDADKAQRAVLFELALGKHSEQQSNPVDTKLESLVRESMKRAADGLPPVKRNQPETKDDMTLDTSYSKGTSIDDFSDSMIVIPRKRSNSLPMEFEDQSGMDTT
jgi:hypothetical protein